MTKLERLQNAYNPESFRKDGHLLIDKLANHLNDSFNNTNKKTLFWAPPEDELTYWKDYLENETSESFFDNLIQHSINLHNPKYIGHQISPTLPLMGLTGLAMSILNNGMGIYEMGVAGTAIERVVTDLLCKHIGYSNESTGFLTAGGTLANLTALLSAKKAFGNENHSNLGVMVSDQSHYSIDRAITIMGLSTANVIKIPTNKNFSVNVSALETSYAEAKSKGIDIFALIGNAPSTATGAYDDLEALASFAKEKQIWYHVDGAHGGSAIFSSTYKPLLKGIEHADSVIIDGHKMLMMPALTTALLFKNENHSYNTFSEKADYLLELSEHKEWYNLAKRTFECTKHMMSIHWYAIIKHYGVSIFDDFVTTLYDSGKTFAKLIGANPKFELAVKPMSNIVCFRYFDSDLNDISLNTVNETVRQHLIKEGDYYILQTKIKNNTYLRCTIMNPFTKEIHFKTLLNKIETIAKTY
ncbi:pyridoxal phosphate-dependent decarboxylase family protein [Winogradskyella immobilis]|uniref:Aminotransferase class I/II-fold pyridoxal phosphate-dependent enzyme n=1 Tax=Winogradskyella immobilis TaxID=2816852 RepID=A0ABS8EKI0_9FLAO|nr:aminotransferase class I/II-fold pyridoxal phosphate-dependent enzyme [Winogradskyella immobilis]MCC1483527.1 aminotransferase class I/II-fold pyridoxal phosphate-dependent enzyme [Winogradskyella immobilis]MCG0015621.1 aminotransferase class I/II-fold pyridoxal phosphate-dependent enzyme [Winogradskyella immobilis]